MSLVLLAHSLGSAVKCYKKFLIIPEKYLIDIKAKVVYMNSATDGEIRIAVDAVGISKRSAGSFSVLIGLRRKLISGND